MAVVRTARQAFGHPGIAPRWTRSAKDVVGTAYAASSRVWFTMSRGVLNEVYYPTVDRPQIRDLQYLITDGRSFFHDERRHLKCTSEYIDDRSLGVRVTSVDQEQRYRIEKEIITSPHQACVLIRTQVTALDRALQRLRLFALLAPHLDGGGWGNSGFVAVQGGREVLVAHKGEVWLALAATIPFLRRTAAGCIPRATACCSPTRTRPIRGRRSPRSRFPGARRRATKTWVATISSGPVTWCTPRSGCSRRATRTYRSGLSFISPARNA